MHAGVYILHVVWRVEVDEAGRRLWVGEKRLFLQRACPKVWDLEGMRRCQLPPRVWTG